jgi:uncharacterized protein (DUF4415 family)
MNREVAEEAVGPSLQTKGAKVKRVQSHKREMIQMMMTIHLIIRKEEPGRDLRVLKAQKAMVAKEVTKAKLKRVPKVAKEAKVREETVLYLLNLGSQEDKEAKLVRELLVVKLAKGVLRALRVKGQSLQSVLEEVVRQQRAKRVQVLKRAAKLGQENSWMRIVMMIEEGRRVEVA